MKDKLSRREFLISAGKVAAIGAIASSGLLGSSGRALAAMVPGKTRKTAQGTDLSQIPPARNAIRKAVVDCREWQEWIRESDILAAANTKAAGKEILKGQFKAYKSIANALEEETAATILRMAPISSSPEERLQILEDCARRFPNTRAGKGALRKLGRSK